jgi:hypothetical protein
MRLWVGRGAVDVAFGWDRVVLCFRSEARKRIGRSLKAFVGESCSGGGQFMRKQGAPADVRIYSR